MLGISLQLPPSHNHSHPARGPQPDTLWVQRLQFDRLSRHQLNRHTLHDRGEDRVRVHHGDMVADAAVWLGTKRELGDRVVWHQSTPGYACNPLLSQHELPFRIWPFPTDDDLPQELRRFELVQFLA
jgi:hypothetical protein